MVKRIFAIIIPSSVTFVGAICLYRAFLKPSDMTIVSRRITKKRIVHFLSEKGGVSNILALTLQNQVQIGINLGTTSEAEKDTTINLLDTSNIYKFYLDPTIPTINDGLNIGIRRIDLRGKPIFAASNNLNTYIGISMTILGIGGIILLLTIKNK